MGGIIFYHMKHRRDNFRPRSLEYNIIYGSRRPGILSRAWDSTLGRRLLGFYGGRGAGASGQGLGGNSLPKERDNSVPETRKPVYEVQHPSA